MPDLFVLLFSRPDLMIGIRTKMQVRAATYARPLCGHLMLFSSPALMMAFEPRWNAGVVVDASKMLHAPTLQVIAIHPRPLCGPWTLFSPPDLIRGI